MGFSKEVLKIDCAAEAERIVAFIREQIRAMHRKGIVIGLSGGVDSALSAALSVEAVGKDKVLALLLPDKESSPQSAEFATKQADRWGSKRSRSISRPFWRPSGPTRSATPWPSPSILSSATGIS